MSNSDARFAVEPEGTPLPKRDWILLPAISLLTMCLLAGFTELACRQVYSRFPTSGENCLTVSDALAGARGIPNCAVWEKMPEGTPTEYRFNSSGYRNPVNFGSKPLGTYRIVMVGSSIAAGFRVAQEESIAGLLPKELIPRMGQNVEVYSAGLPWRSPSAVAYDLADAIALKPDLILWIVSPLDVTYMRPVLRSVEVELPSSAGPMIEKWRAVKAIFAKQSAAASISTIFAHTSSATMLRDLLYRSPSQYVQASLAASDDQKEFLRSEPKAKWQKDLTAFTVNAANIEAQAAGAGITLAVALVPDRTQVAMVSMADQKMADYDPYRLGRELRAIFEGHGAEFIDIVPEFRGVLNPQLGYLALDGHPNALGYRLITNFLAAKLLPVTTSTSKPVRGSQAIQFKN